MTTKLSSVPVIYWTLFTHNEWNFYMAATEQGLSFVGSQSKSFTELETWIGARFPGSQTVQDDALLQPYTVEIIEYLQGERNSFTCSHDLRGTAFQMAVWNALIEIPYGQTWSYSDIAQHIGRPAAVRAVGAAIGANPLLITVPCHRVIGKSGALTGYRGGLEMKTGLLELEKRSARAEAELGIILHDA